MTARAGTDVPNGFFYPFVGMIAILLTAMLSFAGYATYKARTPTPEMEARLRAPTFPIPASGVELACANESRRRPVRLCVALNETARSDAQALWTKASYDDRKACLMPLGKRYDAILALVGCLDPAPSASVMAASSEFQVARRSVEHGCLVGGGDVTGCIETNLAAVTAAGGLWAKATREQRIACFPYAPSYRSNPVLNVRECLVEQAGTEA